MTDTERIAVIEQWLREFSYMKLDDPKTDYFRGIASVFDDMKARLAIWKRNVS